MRAIDTEMIEQADAVGGHVGERIGGAHRQADGGLHEHPFEVRHTCRLETRRQADVAIVVSDGAKPARVERIDELVGPQRQLTAKPHDQQDHRRIARSLVLIGDADAVDGRLFGLHANPLVGKA